MKHCQTGFSMIELLIGLSLSVFIMTGLMNVYLSSKRQYQEYQAQLKKAFDWQWLMSLLEDSIKQAGFTPCMKLDFLKPHRIRSIEITEHGFKVARMHTNFNQIIKIQDANRIWVTSDYPLSSKYPVLISDCVHAEIHQPDHIARTGKGQLVILQRPMAFDYSEIAWIGEWVEEYWYIRKNSRGERALFYKRNKAIELSNVIRDWWIKKQQANGKSWVEIEFNPDASAGAGKKLIAGLRNA